MKWCGALVSETVGVHIEDVKNKMHLCNCIRAPLHCKCIVQVVDYWRSFQTVGKAACGKDATPPLFPGHFICILDASLHLRSSAVHIFN